MDSKEGSGGAEEERGRSEGFRAYAQTTSGQGLRRMEGSLGLSLGCSRKTRTLLMQFSGDLLTCMIRQETAEELAEVLMTSSELQVFVTGTDEGIYGPNTTIGFSGFICRDLRAKKPVWSVLGKEFSRRYVDRPHERAEHFLVRRMLTSGSEAGKVLSFDRYGVGEFKVKDLFDALKSDAKMPSEDQPTVKNKKEMKQGQKPKGDENEVAGEEEEDASLGREGIAWNDLMISKEDGLEGFRRNLEMQEIFTCYEVKDRKDVLNAAMALGIPLGSIRKMVMNLTPLFVEELQDYYSHLEAAVVIEAEDSASALTPGYVDKLIRGQNEIMREVADLKASHAVQMEMVKETWSVATKTHKMISSGGIVPKPEDEDELTLRMYPDKNREVVPLKKTGAAKKAAAAGKMTTAKKRIIERKFAAAMEDEICPDDLFEQLAACCDDSMVIVAYEEAEAVLIAYGEWKKEAEAEEEQDEEMEEVAASSRAPAIKKVSSKAAAVKKAAAKKAVKHAF